MTASFFVRFQATNFEAWLNPDPDGLAAYLKELGVMSYGIHSNPDDPNSIMISTHFADMDALKSYVAFWEEVHNSRASEQPETKIEILESWIGQDLDGYCRTT